jgi:hypothetical protein
VKGKWCRVKDGDSPNRCFKKRSLKKSKAELRHSPKTKSKAELGQTPKKKKSSDKAAAREKNTKTPQ